MAKFKIGDIVKMKSGGESKIIAEFGSGGQGTVYRVLYNDKEYALKWYHAGVFKEKEDAFYKNLEYNITKGAPTDNFLWPLGITEKQNDSFGYIMNIRPSGYEELTSFFVGSKNKQQVRFKSFEAISNAAINIIQAFRELHNKGFSYQDINDGNFFINPIDGHVLICDNDNVSPNGTNLGILGKQRWMAPEIVMLKEDPDKQSDRFSLSVVLFRLLFINHPLEGRYSTPPCMTKELEKKYYGSEPLFIYDPHDSRNRPIPGTDHNLKLFWNVYPQYIRDMFIRAFSQDVMLKKQPRIIEMEWLNTFFRLRAETGLCPSCSYETFYATEVRTSCIECSKEVQTPAIITLQNFKLPVYKGMKIYLWHVDSTLSDISTVIGEVISNTQEPRQLGIRNLSESTIWKVNLPDGRVKYVDPGNVVPVKEGFVVDFVCNSRTTGRIELKK